MITFFYPFNLQFKKFIKDIIMKNTHKRLKSHTNIISNFSFVFDFNFNLKWTFSWTFLRWKSFQYKKSPLKAERKVIKIELQRNAVIYVCMLRILLLCSFFYSSFKKSHSWSCQISIVAFLVSFSKLNGVGCPMVLVNWLVELLYYHWTKEIVTLWQITEFSMNEQ